MDEPRRARPGSLPTYFVFALACLTAGGLFALAARVMGVEHEGILVAVAVIGAGLQALVLLGWYLHFTRPRPQVPQWFAATSDEPAPYKRWPEMPLAGDSDTAPE